MRSLATARETVLFTVPRLIPSAAAISGSVMSSKYLSMTAVRIRRGSRSSATGRIQVRFPRLEPGYLIDVIGLKHDGYLQALIPATSQPPYRAGHPPVAPMVSGHVPDPVSGTAVWHEPGEESVNLLGLAYPALDPETSCEHAASMSPVCPGDQNTVEEWAVDPHATGSGCVRLPYL